MEQSQDKQEQFNKYLTQIKIGNESKEQKSAS